MSTHSEEVHRTVQAHLKTLGSLSAYNADEPTVRVAAGTLRALIVEEMLQRAWKATGLRGPITLTCYCVDSTEGEDVIAYCGGGDILPGVPCSVTRNASLVQRTLHLRDFSRQTRIQVGVVTASTADIIKYAANALGGAHFDPDGKTARKHDLLRPIEAGEIGQMFVQVNKRNALYHEILSIAQAVVYSPQVKELVEWSPPLSTNKL